jgi:hypothetical protein
MSTDEIVLVTITFVAATINGALGYGFSSVTVPVALLFYTNRIVNPALVLVELVINSYVLLINRHSVPHIWKRVLPMLLGVLMGVAIGSYFLSRVQPGWVKLLTYATLLPLLLIQTAGIRKPIKAEQAVSVPFGMGIGLLYALTTISGPPLALLFNNQGYAKQDFRAALSVIRTAESTITAVAYFVVGLYSGGSLALIPIIIPSVFIGIPLGSYLIRWMEPETFRRVCMSFDVVIVGFGLARVLRELELLPVTAAYTALAVILVLNAYLLYQFFRAPARHR